VMWCDAHIHEKEYTWVIEECILNVPHVILPLNCSSVVICNTDFVCLLGGGIWSWYVYTHELQEESLKKKKQLLISTNFLNIYVCVCVLCFSFVLYIYFLIWKPIFFVEWLMSWWSMQAYTASSDWWTVQIPEIFWWIVFCSNSL